MYLTGDEIKELYVKGELVIRPILNEKQFGNLTLDMRLGTDFLVSIQGREPYIDTTGDPSSRSISSFFQETKRLVGECFYLHPHQAVLCSSLEYIKLPNSIFMSITTRSSYSRLGLSVSTIVQPGYCGCISLELTNNSNNPIKLLVGASIIQSRFFKLTNELNYFSTPRKYLCQVKPQPSKANEDAELELLRRMNL